MLNFHLTPALTSQFSIKNHLDETFWFRDITTVFKGKNMLPSLSSRDSTAEKAPHCLQINHVWYSDTEGRCYFYPAEDCWGNYYLSCFDIYTLPNNYFPVMAGVTYHFPYGQKGVRPSLITDKAVLMAAEQQHHLWCWKKAFEVSPPTAGV